MACGEECQIVGSSLSSAALGGINVRTLRSYRSSLLLSPVPALQVAAAGLHLGA